jgi:hypothetical protein
VNVIVIFVQSIDGLCRCNQGSPNISGVFLESVVTKKRQSSLWCPIATDAIKYSVIVSAGFPSARRSDRGRGSVVVTILYLMTVLRSAKALAEHPLSMSPVIVTGVSECARNREVWVRRDLLFIDLSTRGSSCRRQ